MRNHQQMNRGVMILLIALMIADGSMMLALKGAQLRQNDLEAASQRRERFYRSIGDSQIIPPPEGVTASNEIVTVAQHVHPGWAVRYASPKCGYCRKDKEWDRLSADLQRRGFDIYAVSPSASDLYPRETLVPRESKQEAFVSIDWIKHFRLSVTPTLLVFDSDGHLIWAHRKMLSSHDTDAANRAIDAFTKQHDQRPIVSSPVSNTGR